MITCVKGRQLLRIGHCNCNLGAVVDLDTGVHRHGGGASLIRNRFKCELIRRVNGDNAIMRKITL